MVIYLEAGLDCGCVYGRLALRKSRAHIYKLHFLQNQPPNGESLSAPATSPFAPNPTLEDDSYAIHPVLRVTLNGQILEIWGFTLDGAIGSRPLEKVTSSPHRCTRYIWGVDMVFGSIKN